MSSQKRTFILNGRTIALTSILEKDIDPSTEFEKDVIDFCHDWLSGSETFIIKTSGSTGEPKQIKVTRDQIMASIKQTAKALELTDSDTALVGLPASSTGGKMMIARSLHLNMHMECVEPSANPFLKSKSNPTFIALTPYQLAMVLQENPKKLNGLKAILVGGAPVSKQLEEKIKTTVTSPVYATYGMTETVSHIALKSINEKNKKNAFDILPGIEIKTTKDDCLQIKGAVTDDQWITTNDRVELINDKTFKWLGRADFIINSGGVKIQPEVVETAIEAVFNQKKYKNNYFIMGIPHETLGQQCVLFIEGPKPNQGQLKELKEDLDQAMPKHYAPKEIYFISSFESTPSGKIDKVKTAASIKKAP
ncbi:MAG: AMP-binding protein [Candidatus Cyclobacteriaceae bacterium M2_1C_046]